MNPSRTAVDRSRSVPDIVLDVVREFSNLFRTEIRLAGAEVSDKVSAIALAFGMIVAGAVFLMAALVLLLQAAVAGLVAQGLPVWVATLVVAGFSIAIGGGLLWIGLQSIQATNLTPRRTIEQLQRDAAVARQQVGAS